MIEPANVFGGLETLLSEHLYPYRYVITPLMGLAAAALAYAAYQRGLLELLWRHRIWTAVVGAPLLVVAVVAGNYLMSPLWERSFLEEPSPLEAAAGPGNVPSGATTVTAKDQTEAATMLRAGVSGQFRGADDFHYGRGSASIIHTADGKAVLRFEDFSVRNGPDLYVYLSREDNGRRVDEALNLGRLRATDGSFNYEIPAAIDVSGIKSVVVWCRQFSTLFALAPLMPA